MRAPPTEGRTTELEPLLTSRAQSSITRAMPSSRAPRARPADGARRRIHYSIEFKRKVGDRDKLHVSIHNINEQDT